MTQLHILKPVICGIQLQEWSSWVISRLISLFSHLIIYWETHIKKGLQNNTVFSASELIQEEGTKGGEKRKVCFSFLYNRHQALCSDRKQQPELFYCFTRHPFAFTHKIAIVVLEKEKAKQSLSNHRRIITIPASESETDFHCTLKLAWDAL